MNKKNLIGLNLNQLQEIAESIGLEKYRAKQIMAWLYKKGATSFDQMTDIAKPFRQKLEEVSYIGHLLVEKQQRSPKDGTKKVLFRTRDGYFIETVAIIGKDGTTLCVSSQAGCPMKCTYCATGQMGFKRNLGSDEILSQVLYFIKAGITNIVFMGMGEPLLNYSEVMNAIRLLNSKDGMNFGIRRITISTCGLPKEIRKLGAEGLELNLSVSLNAPNDAARDKLMPINLKYPISEIMKAVDYFFQNTAG